jgi:hypothetical protein
MKTLILFVAPLISLSAMAGVSVSKVTSNGTVAPQYRSTVICKIENRQVSVQTIQGTFPHTIRQQAIYTRDVPNETVMNSLAGDAARAPVANHPGPIGGATVSYIANIDAGQATLKQTSGSVVIKENRGAAAKILVKFLDKNCN